MKVSQLLSISTHTQYDFGDNEYTVYIDQKSPIPFAWGDNELIVDFDLAL